MFEADGARQPYEPGRGRLVVSPESSRAVLGDFIAKAKHQLLIYDPKVGDPALVGLLRERLKKSVDVRIIGKVAATAGDLPHEPYPGKRLHVRAMIRDGRDAFVGSQSLRTLELDKRREVGVLLKHPGLVHELVAIFEGDWPRRSRVSAKRKHDRTPAQSKKTRRAEVRDVGDSLFSLTRPPGNSGPHHKHPIAQVGAAEPGIVWVVWNPRDDAADIGASGCGASR